MYSNYKIMHLHMKIYLYRMKIIFLYNNIFFVNNIIMHYVKISLLLFNTKILCIEYKSYLTV